jgi:cholesterol oxidase
MCEHYDAIVIGSGFGGSVMAYRLAKEHMRVCLLERGKKYPPGKFPRTPHEMSANFWDPSAGLHGLFNIWSFKGLDAVVASGLGGGSLIYANVLLRKDPSWFTQSDEDGADEEDWPITYDQLARHYKAVEDVLKPVLYPFESAPYNTTRKTIEFRRAAEKLGLELHKTPLGVTFHNQAGDLALGEPIGSKQYNLHHRERRTCTLCGECDIGCNSGSKNTLDHTYLSMAEDCGAWIRPRCEAEVIRPLPNGGYQVTYIERRLDDEGKRRNKDDLPRKHLTCDQLILSAGALGSTHLLLQNKHRFSRISERVGTRFSGNGDILTVARKRYFHAQPPDIFEAVHGPVITSSIRIPDHVDLDQEDGDSNQRGHYIQDAGFPLALSWFLHTLDLPRAIWAARKPLLKFVGQHLLGHPDPDASAEVAALFGYNRRSAGIMPLLGMGRDIPNGVMRIKGSKIELTRPWKKWNTDYFMSVSQTMLQITEKLNAKFTRSLYYPFRRSVTAHPLGGCPMGSTISQGVVDSHGEVFNYPGFFIADGSVMPGPVGPNPSLTIAALADRFADKVIENYYTRRTFSPADWHRSALHDPTRLRLTEELRGFIAWGVQDCEHRFQTGQRQDPLLAHLTLQVNGVDTFVADPQHHADICGYIKIQVGEKEERWWVERGDFSLPTDDRNLSCLHMHYRLHLRDRSNAKWTLIGVKTIRADRVLGLWHDSSTVSTQIMIGHVEPGQEQNAKVIGAGIIHLSLRDLLRQLTTWRAEGLDLGARLGAYWAFGGLFVRTFWEAYRARPHARARSA